MRPQMMFGLALGAVLLTGCGSAAAPPGSADVVPIASSYPVD
ncbi:MAG TPA: hypothetical protein VIK31_07495 [Propionibacteriaceae bacterium]|jgi:hypothetical protein